jgi:hypothetical protein
MHLQTWLRQQVGFQLRMSVNFVLLFSLPGVTARLAPQCVEDSIKVVIDKKVDQVADTGFFEMIFKQVSDFWQSQTNCSHPLISGDSKDSR